MSSDREVLCSHGLVLSYPNATPGPISESHNNSTIQLLKWLLPPDNPTRSVVSKFLSHPTLRTPSAGTQGLEDGFFLAVLAYHVLPPHVSPNIFLPRLLSTDWGISDRMPPGISPHHRGYHFCLTKFYLAERTLFCPLQLGLLPAFNGWTPNVHSFYLDWCLKAEFLCVWWDWKLHAGCSQENQSSACFGTCFSTSSLSKHTRLHKCSKCEPKGQPHPVF